MRTFIGVILIGVLCSGSAAFGDEPTNQKPTDTKLAGYWLGTIQTGAKELRVLFKITERDSGGLTATMNSLDRDGVERSVDETTFQDGVLRLVLKNLGDY